MNGFSVLFKLGMKKRIKDSFLIGYAIMFPILLIAILGYMASNFYSGENGITSFYYYSLVTMPFCIFLTSVTLVYITREESLSKCGERFIIAPISKVAIVLSKILPSTIVTAIFNLVTILVCKFIFRVDFKERILEIILLFSALAFLSCAIGTFIGLCTKDFMTVKNFISTPIMIMALLGGAFFPIGSLGGIFEIISYVSPLTWINKGLFMMLNDNNMTIYFIALISTLILGLIFLVGAITKFKKEAFL
ncbi:MAG: ABC transporter permease [Clostridium sp.]